MEVRKAEVSEPERRQGLKFGHPFGLSAVSGRSLITMALVAVVIFFIYLMARPLLYYSGEDYQQLGLTAAVTTVGPLLPDSNFDSSLIDPLIIQLKPPIAISVGLFATARVPIVLLPITSNTNFHPNTERWLRRDGWTKTVDGAFAYLKVEAGSPKLQYSWDLIILAVGSAIVATVGLSIFVSPTKSLEVTVPATSAGDVSEPTLAPGEEYMIADVQRAIDTSDQLFTRSTLLLVGGVVMAFVGVGVFFLSLFSNDVQTTPISSLFELLSSPRFLSAFRSFAMLLFIEAIAWFLLRQYRSLIEDYKSFYRYYMRRANYLAAIKISGKRGGDAQFALVVKTLLAEDLTGRLKKDETTETLEGQRLIDANFVESVAVTASGAIPRRAKTESKPKHVQEAGQV